MKRVFVLVGIAFSLLISSGAQARLTKFVVTSVQSPTFGGYFWPGVGQYERIAGVAYGELNPSDPKNAVIVDLQLAPRNANGNVEYNFDFYILKPTNLKNGAHKVMYEPPNRGNKTWAGLGRFSGSTNDPGSQTDPTVLANAFFMPRGYTIVFSGWDQAAPQPTTTNPFSTAIRLPVAQNPDGSAITGPGYEYIVTSAATYTLTYPAATLDQSRATLTHRIHLDDPPQVVPASGWKYNSANSISLTSGGFVGNDIYEFMYTATNPTVNTVGLAAIRDFNAWLRYERRDDVGTANPLAGDIQRIYTEVVSQPGRTLNDFRRYGFNQAENGKMVFDGMLQWIAAADGLSMNFRWSQPGRTERNRQEHLFNEATFPFANVATFDPISGRTDSRLAKCEATHTCPRSMEIYSSNEYWVKAASLLHTTPDGTRDLPDSPFARDYLISSHQHGTGSATSRGACQQFQNPLNSAPVQRALWVAMDEWVTEGKAPPPTHVPTFRDGTLVPVPAPLANGTYMNIPGTTYTGLKTTRYRFNYGPGFYDTGIPLFNPPLVSPPMQDNPRNGPIYPSFVPRVDSDGNEIAGVHLADVTVPVATYTGWALRSGVWANDGCEGSGQYIPFAKTAADRAPGGVLAGDPRASVAERYASIDDYAAKISRALGKMVDERLLLCEDYAFELNRLVALGMSFGLAPDTSGNAPRVAAIPRQCTDDDHDHDRDRDRDRDRDDR